MMTVKAPTRPQRQFESSQFYFSLWRLTDDEYCDLRTHSFPIQYDALFLWHLRQSDVSEYPLLNLPKLLFLLEKEFGRSSKLYDEWKQGFSFPYLLAIQKAIGPLYYLLKIADYRGGIEFNLFRVIDNVKYINENPEHYHPPIADELTETEIQHMVSYIWGFYQGYAESYFKSEPHITPFFRDIPSNHLIYGYWEDHFVEQFFEREEDYREVVTKLEVDYGESAKSEQDEVCVTQAMILRIMAQ